MKLLVATDNTFFRTPEGVWDVFCFDRGFFDDYRAVFEDVIVAARMSRVDPPANAHRSDGGGVRFVDLANVHGGRWALAPMRVYCGALPAAAREADAVCVRIPAVSGVFAARLARRLGKPLMFEQVGDPLLIGAFGLRGRLFGRYLALLTRRIVRSATVGSYVSQRHLQRRYPAGPDTITDGISSIRLPDEAILPAKRFEPGRGLRLILVASLHRYKDHETLLRAVARLRADAVPATADLLGDGPMRQELETRARELGVSDWVTFHGHVAGRDRVNALLDRSHVFVMPSLGEGMPRAMIEAMSRGLPAVGARTLAMEELLPVDQMFPVGNHEVLAAKLSSAIRDPRILWEWASHGERVVKNFAASVLSGRRRQLLGLLRESASERRRHRG